MLEKYAFLYVEDDPLSCQIMRTIMRAGLGVESLTIFQDSKDFLARVRALDPVPDVFLLDIHLKPLNGFEMLTLLRSDPAFADKKVVALTASVMNEEIEQLRRSGFNSAIAKPLSISTFPALLKAILDGETVWHVS